MQRKLGGRRFIDLHEYLLAQVLGFAPLTPVSPQETHERRLQRKNLLGEPRFQCGVVDHAGGHQRADHRAS